MGSCLCRGEKFAEEEKYDAAFSDGVFHYFPDEAYAQEVMEGMLKKARGNIAVLDVHDAAKRHDLDVSFDPLTLAGYWNAPFIYSVFFSRREK